MSSNVKIVWKSFLVVVVFAFAIGIDALARSYFGGAMKIDGLPINNASVIGVWKPDFFWSGKAWWIDIQSEADLELSLDGRIYMIPKGSHSIYSNHDHTNTPKFGDTAFWGYPMNVAVRRFDRAQQK
jgi:hypothetical protein